MIGGTVQHPFFVHDLYTMLYDEPTEVARLLTGRLGKGAAGKGIGHRQEDCSVGLLSLVHHRLSQREVAVNLAVRQ
jgi:hypothetical protein